MGQLVQQRALRPARPTLPWGLQIHQWDEGAGRAVRDSAGHPVVLGTFQPTFLYESLWCVGVAVAVVLLERRYRLDRGRTFAAYVMLYTVGRAWIEYLRVDQAHHFLGLRLNDWVALWSSSARWPTSWSVGPPAPGGPPPRPERRRRSVVSGCGRRVRDLGRHRPSAVRCAAIAGRRRPRELYDDTVRTVTHDPSGRTFSAAPPPPSGSVRR